MNMGAIQKGVGARNSAESRSRSPASGSSRELRLIEVKGLAATTSMWKG